MEYFAWEKRSPDQDVIRGRLEVNFAWEETSPVRVGIKERFVVNIA